MVSTCTGRNTLVSATQAGAPVAAAVGAAAGAAAVPR